MSNAMRPAGDPEHGLRERNPPVLRANDGMVRVDLSANGARSNKGKSPVPTDFRPTYHWGLNPKAELNIFWTLAIISWCLEIAAAVVGSLYHSSDPRFIGTMSAFLITAFAAWSQTVFGMLQRASWIRDEDDLEDRRTFLILAVRLNRLMMPTAFIALVVFIQAYVRRHSTHDLPYWLLFQLSFIFAIVFSVMNAYNNISWENTRLKDEGEIVFQHTRLAVLGIPN